MLVVAAETNVSNVGSVVRFIVVMIVVLQLRTQIPAVSPHPEQVLQPMVLAPPVCTIMHVYSLFIVVSWLGEGSTALLSKAVLL